MDINKGKNSQFFGEITIMASPPIYIFLIDSEVTVTVTVTVDSEVTASKVK